MNESSEQFDDAVAEALRQTGDIFKDLGPALMAITEEVNRILAQHAQLLKRIEELEANVAFRP